MARQVIFIASRAHSGSTFLELLLSRHPKVVGLGELYNLFDFKAGFIFSREKIKCSCGETLQGCPFWGSTTDQILNNQHLPPQKLYGIVFKSFFDYFGDDYIPVDVSRTVDALEVLRFSSDVDVKVIFLIRDVRPWIISMREALSRREDLRFGDLWKNYKLAALFQYVLRTPIKFFWQWYFHNRKTQAYLERNGLEYIQTGYEEICLNTNVILEQISQFLGISLRNEDIVSDNWESHVALGNPMRHQQRMRTRIYYDYRWFYRREWQLPALLFPNIMKYNLREVYRNSKEQAWR